ncbi:hypothetical protein [Agromyces badenianii]|uniref:hypothetical protein n=1 Tax=Agromyces badenianii TaxID=2080742 RepID=UPI001059A5EE|nr:hypothetical protein [Agromyces badenianii]
MPTAGADSGASTFDETVGELSWNGEVRGYTLFHVSGRGGLSWSSNRPWRITREPTGWVEVEEWIVDTSGAFSYNRDRSGPESAFSCTATGKYWLAAAQVGEKTPDGEEEVEADFRWLVGDEARRALAKVARQ